MHPVWRSPRSPRRGSIALLALLLAACGGDFSGSAGPMPAPTPTSVGGDSVTPPPAGDTIEIEARLASGGDIYLAQCQSCHGVRGQGGIGGGLNRALTCPGCSTLDGLTRRIHDTMPSSNPQNCRDDCAADVALFIRNNFSAQAPGTPTPGTPPPGGNPPTTPDDDACVVEPTPTAAPGETPPGGTPAPTATAPPPSPSPPPPAGDGCEVTFTYSSSWQVGFVANIALRNDTSSPVSDWQVTWTFPNDQRVTNSWDTTLTQTGQSVRAVSRDYNRTLAANGGTVSFGMQGAHGGVNALPTDVRLEAPGCGVVMARRAVRKSCSPPDGNPANPVQCDLETPSAPRLLRLLTRNEYQRSVEALTGLSDSFAADIPIEARVMGYDNNARVALVTSRHMDRYLEAGARVAAAAIPARRAALVPCDIDGNRTQCTQQFVAQFGAQAFRRPVTVAERDRYAALMDTALADGSTDDGLRLIIQALLSSPHFLYRSEVGQASGDHFRLDGYETATALAYLFTGGPPDSALTADAASGRLSTADGREAAARRLLATPAARTQMAHFAAQWLGTDTLPGAFKDPDIYPRFSPAVRAAMTEELARFINHVVFDSAVGTVDELIAADYVIVNDALRSFYRLPGGGSGWQQQTVTDGSRGGLLGLGAVMAAQAHSNESSPIKRGVFVRERLLCHELPDPPPDVDTTPPGLDPSLTTRERFRRHTDDPNCASCHNYIDGIGFGLERYDGVGDFRSTENGQPVDDSGALRGPEGFADSRRPSFNGMRELAELLRQTQSLRQCTAIQYYRYARGYTETAADDCALAHLFETFEASGGHLQTLMIELVRQPGFVLRRAE